MGSPGPGLEDDGPREVGSVADVECTGSVKGSAGSSCAAAERASFLTFRGGGVGYEAVVVEELVDFPPLAIFELQNQHN